MRSGRLSPLRGLRELAIASTGGVGLFLVLTAAASGQAPPQPPSAQGTTTCPAPAGLVRDLEHPLAAVRYLSDDQLQGRLAGTEGERCTAEYIAREFARIGLEPVTPGGAGGGYFQTVELQSAVNPHAPEGTGTNVIGILEGSDPARRSEAVVLGAHHDHLGLGEMFGSLADAPGEVHNGADDNASGVGALLAVAEALAASPPARTVVFVTFSGEEAGLLGSSRYVQDPSVPVERTVGMVNLDMVGRLAGQPLIVNGTGTAEEWNEILDAVERAEGIPLARSPEGYGPSDHTSFYARDVPVLHYFTNVHGQYHRPEDDWELIDRAGLERVTLLVEATIRAVADRPERLTHVAGAGAPQTMASSGNRAYLGTIPDFAPVDFGVRLSGVTDGSPADEGGLRAGDVLIRLGPFEIEDLYVMTDALDQLEAGAEVEATVVRDGEELTFMVRLRERPAAPPPNP